MKTLGYHLLVEYCECDTEILNSAVAIEKCLEEAAVKSGATVLAKNFHKFSPHGVSGVVLIAESHLAIHTWPEFGYAAVDFFTCGDTADPWKAHAFLQQKLCSKLWTTKEYSRGLIQHQQASLAYQADASNY